METVAYVYKWVHMPTGKWYIGSRTRVGSHPDDGYYCSSKTVKPLILANPDEWKREIIATGDPFEMRDLETKLLRDANAKHDDNSFNQHNNDRSPIRTGILGIGLMLFVLKGLYRQNVWKDQLIGFSFWSINIGLPLS